MPRYLLFTIGYIIFCISTLFHEWSHSALAVVFDVKTSIFDINYSYLPFLLGIDENVNYELVAQLPPWQAQLICGAGIIANGIMALITFLILFTSRNKTMRILAFLFAFFNVSDWFNYLTFRTLIPRGDIENLTTFGMNHTFLILTGLSSSLLLFYLLCFPARKMLFHTPKQPKALLETTLPVFFCMQIGELLNDVLMY